jgi:hypothetical protein
VGVKIGAKGRGLQRRSGVGESAIELFVCKHSSFEHGELLKHLGVFDATRGYPVPTEQFSLLCMDASKTYIDLEYGTRAWWQGYGESWCGVRPSRKGKGLTGNLHVKESNEVMFNATGRVHRPDDSPGKVARARGIYEDELVVMTPI